MEKPRYLVRRATTPPQLDADWNAPAWAAADVLPVDRFLPNGSPDHRPRVEAKLLYDDAHLYVHFRVFDRYVRCVHVGDQADVFLDSCVELFVQPTPDVHRGYLNFEMNCGGSLLLYHILEPSGVPSRPVNRFEPLPERLLRQVRRYHSLPERVDPEITDPTEWRVAYAVPFSLFEEIFGPVEAPATRRWRANLYKCGDRTSHPHWASWSPLEQVNFHDPDRFGTLEFERKDERRTQTRTSNIQR